MMKILAIDTSTRNLSLAVADNDQVLCYSNKQTLRLSSSIVSGIRSILKKAGVPLNKIEAFAVGLGPGSFTSLRVGLSTIKALAFAENKPVSGVASLDALAAAVGTSEKDVCVMVDARRNLVYSAMYSYTRGKRTRKTDYLLTPVGDVLKCIQSDVVITGDAIGLYKDDILQSASGKKCRIDFTPEKLWKPQARFLVGQAYQRLREKRTDNIGAMTPIYLYPEDCQVRR